MSLKPGSRSYERWKVTPFPLYMKLYFWNWTNARESYYTRQIPEFSEVGPYVFRENHEKVNLTWNNNGTVSYRVIKRWYFEPEMTNGSLSDLITSVNVVAASAAYMAKDANRFFLIPISMMLRTTGQEIWWTKNVSELLFEGFVNPLQTLGVYVKGQNTPDRFGFFYKKNGTVSSQLLNMGTGTESFEDIGQLKYVDYRNSTDLYPDCRRISGSTGEFWPPDNDKLRPLVMYSPDMCRKLRFYFEEESAYNGLRSFAYAGTPASVDNGSSVPENKCYCNERFCPPSGVFDLTKCAEGAPIYISYPHFYNADPSYRQAVRGMSPDPEKHKYFVRIEPETGVQLEVAARTQVNVYLSRNSGLSLFRNVTDVFVPVFWMDTHVSLTEEYTSGLSLMKKMLLYGPFVFYGFVVAGLIAITVVVLLHFTGVTSMSCVKKNLKRNKPEGSKEENVLYSFRDIDKEEVKYVLPEDRL
ncbi:UNVERIFIED_CONTAM: hypothetical protein PYX00_007054 [Menopon gallinae]